MATKKKADLAWRDQYGPQLENLDNLGPDELAELESSLVDEFDHIDGADGNGSLTDLAEISNAISSIREKREAASTQISELRANVHPPEDTVAPEDPDGDESDDDDDTDAGEDDDDDEDSDSEIVAPPAGPVSVAASVKKPSIKQLARAQTLPVKRLKNRAAARVATRLVAAGDIPGFGVGQEITTHESLTQAFIRKLEALGRGGTPDDVLVASLIKEYPPERTLGDDPIVNTHLIDAVIKPQALIAYGGICAPLAVDYSVPTIGSTARPVQASLPSFAATRGGVQFMTPPVLSSITPPVPWTNADDTGGTKTKACMKVVCLPNQSAYVYGIPVCLEVGNMMGRFNQEQVGAQTSLLDVATARVAELTLLSIIDQGSTAVTSSGVLGTTRTILPTLDLLISGYRYRYRLDTASLRCILPEWVKDEMRADLTMELAHDRDGQDNLATTDADIAKWFAARGVTVTWALEDLAGSFSGAQAAGALNPWPATFVAYFYAEGTWQYLDGGRIDVGVVRDSTLNSTNDYQIWREDFEGLAKRGNESLKVTVTAKPTGLSAGSVDTGA